MAERSVVVRLAASVSSYVASMRQAERATEQVGTAADTAGRRQSQSARDTAAAASAIATVLNRTAQASQNAARMHGMYYDSAGRLVDASGNIATATQAATAGLDRYSQEVADAATATDRAAQAAARAGGPLQRMRGTLNDVAASARDNRQAWDQAGTALTTFGTVTVGALGFAAKAAMDWESAWAGVTKTVDGTPEQMMELEGSLRELAKTLPLTHTEIAAVAEAAGQLGVAREDVVGFTKTMIDLGESTNLTADEAATQIAQISNVMGTMARDGAEGVARFGATLVELGNNGASTEADILAMAQRISGAMATVGGTEVELLAVSNALSSMGVKAELGGGVMTRVLLKMYDSVKTGGAGLEAFAKTAGVSASEFAAAFQRSPVEALAMVSQGLGRVKDEGGNVVASLADMGLKGTETTQVMLSLANSGTMLADGLAQGAKAHAANTALMEEADERYETTASKVKIAWNGIVDAAIDAGAVVLPVVQQIAESVADMAEVWGNLPAPVQGAIAGLSGVAGAAALAAGGLLLIVPRTLETIDAFRTLSKTSDGAANGLSKVGKAAGAAGAIAAVGFTIAKIAESSYMDDIDTGMGRVALAVTKVANESPDASAALDDLFKQRDGSGISAEVSDLESAIDRMFNPTTAQKFDDWGQRLVTTTTGIEGSLAAQEDAFGRVDTALSDLVASGDIDGAATAFGKLQQQMIDQGATTEEVAALFPQYADALAGVAAEQEAAGAGAEGTADALGLAGAAAEEAAAASEEMIEALAELGISAEGTIIDLQKFTDMLFDMGLATMSSREAAFGWEETLRGMGAAASEIAGLGDVLNGTGTDFNMLTDSGKAANEMLQGIVSDGLQVAETFSGDLSKSAADVNQQLISTYNAGVQAAMGLGLGKDEAIALTRELMGIPPGVSIETWMSEAAEMRADTTGEAIGEIPESVYVESAMNAAAFETAGMTKTAVDDVPDQALVDTWMSDAAFQEALRTRAAALGIPEQEVIDSFMSSAARNEADATTSRVLAIPLGASVSSFMDAYARDMANQTSAAINAIPRYVESVIVTRAMTINTSTSDQGYSQNGGVGGLADGGRIPRHAAGGKLPAHAGGYRLPTTGPGTEVTDGILGISTKTGAPISWLDGGEQITSARMTEKHSDLLWAIHRDDPRLSRIPALAGGGRPTSREYAPAMSYAGPSTADTAAAVAASLPTHATVPVRLTIDGRELHKATVRAAIEYS